MNLEQEELIVARNEDLMRAGCAPRHFHGRQCWLCRRSVLVSQRSTKHARTRENVMALRCIDSARIFYFYFLSSWRTLLRLAFPEWPTEDMDEHQLETVVDRREDMINITTRTTTGHPIG